MNIVTQKLKILGSEISQNSPILLTACGCGGVFATAVLTGRSALKASKLIEAKMELHGHLSTQDIIRETWKIFIPPIIVGGLSIACIIGANSINTKRNAALAALYSLSEGAFREYKNKVVEEIGKQKETHIRDGIAQDRILTNPANGRDIVVTGYGDILCYDVLCDRYFTSSPEKIRQQVLEFNYRLMNEDQLSLNDLYECLGLKPSRLGEQSYFYADKGLVEVRYSSCLNDHDVPCLSIDMDVYPRQRW